MWREIAADERHEIVVDAGDEVQEQTAILIQEQMAKAGVTINITKVDPSSSWQMEVDGEYDLAINYWTNDVIDPDQNPLGRFFLEDTVKN